jgi:hypothetical protein
VITDAEIARVKHYRLKAEELRTAADGMQYPDSRLTLNRLAQTYDAMADRLETPAVVPVRRTH